MLPSPPSVEDLADDAFRIRRVTRLRRGHRHVGSVAVLVVVIVVIAAIAITSHNSAPDDRLDAAPAVPAEAATALRQAGTDCVGWPVSLTPSTKPSDRAGSVSLWGDRSAFHLRNATEKPVIVEVRATGGEARGLDDGVVAMGGGALRASIGPALEARFTLACSATAVRLNIVDHSGSPRRAAAFQLGTGAADGPLTITKVPRP